MCGGLCADLNRENNDKTSSGKNIVAKWLDRCALQQQILNVKTSNKNQCGNTTQSESVEEFRA